MKAYLSAFAAILFCSPMALADAAADLISQANSSYSSRDYDAAGVQAAKQAGDLYGQAVAQASDATVRAKALVGQSMAIYFVADASNSNDVKKELHLKGMELADQAAEVMGLSDVAKASDQDVQRLKGSLSAEQMRVLGDALYYRGINLGQWGAANGVVDSLNRWPELRDNMQLLVNLGLREMHGFGAFRVLGRGYYKIPTLLGGSMKRAEQYLSAALKGTLASGQTFSTNGYNNIYLADVLRENGRAAEAKAILEGFVAADVKTLDPESVPENRRSQKEAQDLLKGL